MHLLTPRRRLLLSAPAILLTAGMSRPHRNLLLVGGGPTFAKQSFLAGSLGGWTLSRSSAGTRVNASGVFETLTANITRFDYSRTSVGTILGLLVEPLRNNGIRNSSNQGASTSPSTYPTNWIVQTDNFAGYTAPIVNVGTDSGIDFVDIHVSGTPSSATYWAILAEQNGIIAATQGQSVTDSVFLKLVSGSFTNVSNMKIGFQEYNSSGTFTANTRITTTTFPTNGSLLSQRNVATLTVSAATTSSIAPWVSFSLTPGSPIDFTMRVAWPDLEIGAFVTTPIVNTGVSVPRQADILTTRLAPGTYARTVVGGTISPSGTAYSDSVSVPASGVYTFAWPTAAATAGERHLQSITMRKTG